MIYRVYVKISYCEAYFDFNDIMEAGAWMSTAAEKYVGGDCVNVRMEIVREEERCGK